MAIIFRDSASKHGISHERSRHVVIHAMRLRPKYAAEYAEEM